MDSIFGKITHLITANDNETKTQSRKCICLQCSCEIKSVICGCDGKTMCKIAENKEIPEPQPRQCGMKQGEREREKNT